MLFNSFEFLLVFLPITVLLFYLVGSTSRSLAIRWLIVASLLFYGAWRPVNVLIIAPSIAINFVLASVLLRLRKEKGPNRMSKVVLVVGILFNVVFLGIFKYDDFIAGSINDAFGTSLILQHLVLPLGISFITFQKIAFLVDVQAGRVRSFTFQEYCTFGTFLSTAYCWSDCSLSGNDAAIPCRKMSLRQKKFCSGPYIVAFRFVQKSRPRR